MMPLYWKHLKTIVENAFGIVAQIVLNCKLIYQSWLFRQACVLVEVLNGAVQERDPLLQLSVEGLPQ